VNLEAAALLLCSVGCLFWLLGPAYLKHESIHRKCHSLVVLFLLTISNPAVALRVGKMNTLNSLRLCSLEYAAVLVVGQIEQLCSD
jgi:hypothetical protein